MPFDPLAIFRELGTPSDLRSLADKSPPQGPLAGNAHIHLPPNFSAFTTARQAMELADAQNCRIVGTSNYYDYEVYRDFAAEARQRNVFPLFGLEIICLIDDLQAAGIKINDPGNPGKMYVCGKGITRFTAMTAEAQRILGTIRRNDSQRTSKVVDRLARVLAERGLPNNLNTDMVIDMVVRRHGAARATVYLQERHVAQAFQEYIFANIAAGHRIARLTALCGAPPKIKSPDDHVGVQNELRTHLIKAGKPAYVDETFIEFDPAIRLILELGGIPCYPLLADAVKPICPFEEPLDKLIGNLKARNFHAAEFITVRNTLPLIARYTKALRAAGIIVTAGTEHNTLDLIPMAPVCAGNAPIPPDLQAIFYEGACVIAAHQFLNAHGQVGYVDAAGQLNPAYGSVEERIAALARLGDAVIRRYLARKPRRHGEHEVTRSN